MSKFKRLEKFQASSDKALPYTLYQIEGEPVLMMVQATDANKKYWDALLRRNSTAIRRMRGGKLNAVVLEQTRDNDRELFSKFVIKGWEKVLDDENNLTPFSQEDCHDFLCQLPNWIFDDVRNFAADAQNFIEDDLDEAATSGN